MLLGHMPKTVPGMLGVQLQSHGIRESLYAPFQPQLSSQAMSDECKWPKTHTLPSSRSDWQLCNPVPALSHVQDLASSLLKGCNYLECFNLTQSTSIICTATLAMICKAKACAHVPSSVLKLLGDCSVSSPHILRHIIGGSSEYIILQHCDLGTHLHRLQY